MAHPATTAVVPHQQSRFRNAARRFLAVATRPATVAAIVRRITETGAVPAGVWSRLPVHRPFRIRVEGQIGFDYAPVPNDQIGRMLYWRGFSAWEPGTTGTFISLVRRARTILDIGANTGVYSLLAASVNPAAHVHAFEPVPRIFELLRRNVEINHLESRVTLHSEAVADAAGNTSFHVPQDDVPTSASLNPSGFRNVAGTLITVPVTTLDALFCDDETVDLAKIDVEGFEDKVLTGMRSLLARMKPTLLVECNPDGPYREVEAILRPFGYRFFHLGKNGPMAVESIVPDATGEDKNFLCVAREL